MDIFEFRSSQYLLVIDYFSRYIEAAPLQLTASRDVINQAKNIFSRHGIPSTVISDNGPQFRSRDFATFANEYGFRHVTSSPNYPQGNGDAERAVQTVKNLFTKSMNPHMALLTYRSTPLSNGYSPAELLMSRKLRATVPLTLEQMKPSIPDIVLLRRKEEVQKQKGKENFDKRHRARELPVLETGDRVWIADKETSGTVVEQTAPRSYLVSTPQGIFRRNRRQLNSEPVQEEGGEEEESLSVSSQQDCHRNSDQSVQPYVTRSGRIVRRPEKLNL